MEKSRLKSNITLCLLVLLALGLVTVIAQVRIPLDFDAVAQQFNSSARPFYITIGVERPNYRFVSCSGGDSVNCHTHGNQAGL